MSTTQSGAQSAAHARVLPPAKDEVYAWGAFELRPNKRLLLKHGAPVSIGGRALDILIALLDRPDQLVSKAELMRKVWPGIHVVEGNLTVHIAALRRALDEGGEEEMIVNVPGRGYQFVASVTAARTPASRAHAAEHMPPHNLRLRLTPLVGRDAIVLQLTQRLCSERLLTLTGAGGIGKSAVAAAISDRLIWNYPDGVWHLDVSTIRNLDEIANAVGRLLHFDLRSTERVADLAIRLREKKALLVFDNCTHLVEDVRVLAVDLLQAAPELHILVTSRQPLRAEGEHVHRLAPLDCPPETARVTAESGLRFPAVDLFTRHAADAIGNFELTDINVALVGQICRELDGNPLAIQLAAARVDVLGLDALAEQVVDEPLLLAGGGVIAWHQTMAANLDRSYALLTDDEQRFFRRVSIFDRGFTLSDAVAAVDDPAVCKAFIVNQLAELVLKSLLTVDLVGKEPTFSMSGIARSYALQKRVEARALDVPATAEPDVARELQTQPALNAPRVLELVAAPSRSRLKRGRDAEQHEALAADDAFRSRSRVARVNHGRMAAAS